MEGQGSTACSLPTPSLSHLTTSDYQEVYEPSGDSFLLMDALEKDAALLRELRPLMCVEVGSGSGAVITFLAQLLNPHTAFSLSTDINKAACRCTVRTLSENGVTYGDAVVMDLMSSFHRRLRGQVDVLLFNPPYVVTPPEEVGSHGIEASWAGGEKGREVTDRLLPHVKDLLSPLGLFYLVVLPENEPEEICSQLAEVGMKSQVVLSRRVQNERLSVLRFSFCESVT